MISDKRALARVGAALAVILIFTAGVREVRKTSVAPDFPCAKNQTSTSADPAKDVLIKIAKGATGSEIATQLFESGIVKSARSFFGVAVGDPRAAKIAPGSHLLTPGLCANDALNQLLDSKRISGLINIFEGAWNTEIFAQMKTAGFSARDIEKAAASAVLPQGFKTLEGLLFPAQYSFAEGTSAQVAIQTMLERSANELVASGVAKGDGKYTAQNLVTIASIIQAEGNTQDFTKVSRVIRNRLEKGMPLQMDSTVHYLKKDRGKIFLSTASTFLKSPYNTYRNYGLPPGPIGNPGAAALKAAANPEVGDWIYFITVAPFDTRFTSSNEQFSKWKVEYKKNLRDGRFRSAK